MLEEFHPALPTPLNVERVTVDTSETVRVRVMWVVLVMSGLTSEKLVDAYAGGETVAVSERVVCGSDEVLGGSCEVLGGSAGTSIVVVATTSETPLEGELPLIQLVVPELAENMKGVVLAGSATDEDESPGVAKTVVVLKKVDVAVRVVVGDGGSGCWADSAATPGQTVWSTKTEVV